jgi:hypothetical protein
VLVETIDQSPQIVGQQRLGLAYGFTPRLGVLTPFHTRAMAEKTDACLASLINLFAIVLAVR